MRVQVVAVFGLSLLSACSLPFSPGRAIILPIREIQAPQSVGSTVPFNVTFVVESGGCRTFQRMELQQSASGAVVFAHGRDTSGPNVGCPADIRREPKQLTMSPPFTDPFVIRAGQPDGSSIASEVRVVQ